MSDSTHNPLGDLPSIDPSGAVLAEARALLREWLADGRGDGELSEALDSILKRIMALKDWGEVR